MDAEALKTLGGALQSELSRVIVGKPDSVRDAVVTLFCGGHLLVEDVPGVGKTTLAKALAKALGGEFRRVQFTPDLLPSDVTGGSILNRTTNQFEFQPGPVFANVVLVDEVNRATPKTQSALLEAMEERQVTVDGVTRPLPEPFMVIATQNNIEMTGTYPLPEAQLDRFLARVSLGYPDRSSEAAILSDQQTTHPLQTVSARATLAEITAAQAAVRKIFVHDSVKEYVVDVVRATRDNAQLALGSSPRGSLYLMLAGQARAGLEGSAFVTPDHIKAVAPLVLGHRVIVRAEARARGATGPSIIQQIMGTVATPTAFRPS